MEHLNYVCTWDWWNSVAQREIFPFYRVINTLVVFSSNYHLLICSENHESHSPHRTNWCLTVIITSILSPRLSSFSRILRSVNFTSNKPIYTIVGNLYALITAHWYWFCLLFENAVFLICIINKTYCQIVGDIYTMLLLHTFILFT